MQQESGPSRPRGPVDWDHLDRQTFGDEALAREVLQLFAGQARAAATALREQSRDGIPALMHGLKGSARMVGAFPLADCAAALESAPGNASLAAQLEAALSQVLNAIEARTG